jgi:hypothetical protein
MQRDKCVKIYVLINPLHSTAKRILVITLPRVVSHATKQLVLLFVFLLDAVGARLNGMTLMGDLCVLLPLALFLVQILARVLQNLGSVWLEELASK